MNRSGKIMKSLKGLKGSAVDNIKDPFVKALKDFAEKYPNKSIGLSVLLYSLAAVLVVLGVGSIAAALSTSLNILGSLVPILQSSTNPLLMGLVSSIVGGLATLKASVLSKAGVRASQKEIEKIEGSLTNKGSLKQILNNILARSVVKEVEDETQRQQQEAQRQQQEAQRQQQEEAQRLKDAMEEAKAELVQQRVTAAELEQQRATAAERIRELEERNIEAKAVEEEAAVEQEAALKIQSLQRGKVARTQVEEQKRAAAQQQQQQQQQKEFINKFATVEQILELYYQEARDDVKYDEWVRKRGQIPTPLMVLTDVVEKVIKSKMAMKVEHIIESQDKYGTSIIRTLFGTPAPAEGDLVDEAGARLRYEMIDKWLNMRTNLNEDEVNALRQEVFTLSDDEFVEKWEKTTQELKSESAPMDMGVMPSIPDGMPVKIVSEQRNKNNTSLLEGLIFLNTWKKIFKNDMTADNIKNALPAEGGRDAEIGIVGATRISKNMWYNWADKEIAKSKNLTTVSDFLVGDVFKLTQGLGDDDRSTYDIIIFIRINLGMANNAIGANYSFFNLSKNKIIELTKKQILNNILPYDHTSENSRTIVYRLLYWQQVRSYIMGLISNYKGTFMSSTSNEDKARILLDLYMVCACFLVGLEAGAADGGLVYEKDGVTKTILKKGGKEGLLYDLILSIKDKLLPQEQEERGAGAQAFETDLKSTSAFADFLAPMNKIDKGRFDEQKHQLGIPVYGKPLNYVANPKEGTGEQSLVPLSNQVGVELWDMMDVMKGDASEIKKYAEEVVKNLNGGGSQPSNVEEQIEEELKRLKSHKSLQWSSYYENDDKVKSELADIMSDDSNVTPDKYAGGGGRRSRRKGKATKRKGKATKRKGKATKRKGKATKRKGKATKRKAKATRRKASKRRARSSRRNRSRRRR
jgi:hypothetical protein